MPSRRADDPGSAARIPAAPGNRPSAGNAKRGTRGSPAHPDWRYADREFAAHNRENRSLRRRIRRRRAPGASRVRPLSARPPTGTVEPYVLRAHLLERESLLDPCARRAPHACCARRVTVRSEEHTSELQSQSNLVCRLLLEKKNGQAHKARRATAVLRASAKHAGSAYRR